MICVKDPWTNPGSAEISPIVLKKLFTKPYLVDLEQNSTSFSAYLEQTFVYWE